ncbi:MAG: carbohydrate binding domain-containing protein [Myxococcales bacterium]
MATSARSRRLLLAVTAAALGGCPVSGTASHGTASGGGSGSTAPPGGSSGTAASSGSSGGAASSGGSSGGSAATGTASGGSGGSSTGGGTLVTPTEPELWYWHHSYLSAGNAQEPAHSEALIDQAAAAGYTGLALWDSSTSFLALPGWDSSKITAVVDYAAQKGMKVLPGTAEFGYSNDILHQDPNLAEGDRVVGSQFTVVSGTGGNVLQPVNSLPPVGNGGFESGKTVWFGMGDARVVLDANAADCHTGNACAEILGSSTATDNARLATTLSLTPWRLYHVQLWVRTAALAGNQLTVEVIDWSQASGLTRLNAPIGGLAATQGWTQVDFLFDSRDSAGSVTLYIGMWGGNQGNVFVDDIAVEETALVNVLRRGGTPVAVTDASGTAYTEGQDYAPIVDPNLSPSPGNYDYWHPPPVIAVPGGSKLQLGQTVSVSSYSVMPLSPTGQVGICLSEPAVQQQLQQRMTLIAELFPSQAVFLGYDEMRQVNSCELCRSQGLTAGGLLAWNVGQTWATITAVLPNAQGYVWSDMFDPHHNATATYQDEYPVEGDLTGSWAGLPDGITVMNWNLGKLAQSLGWFAGQQAGQPRGFPQIIAGYYDSGQGAASAQAEMAAAAGIPGVQGVMYTTWQDDYSQLSAYADAVRAAWPAYVSSVP